MSNATFTCNRLLLGATLALAIGAAQPAAAQEDTPTGGPTITPTTPSTPTSPTTVPLDGGASLLLAGGVAYGLRQLRQRRRPQ